MFRFAHPAAFQWLWLIPIILVLAWAFNRRAQSRLQRAFGQRLTPYLASSQSVAKRRIRLILFCVSLVFYVMALARPQMGRGQTAVKAEGVELMIAVDVSNSMLAEDVKPSRLDYAKSELIRLMDMLGGDKVGLIAFAGSATLISPLTSDKSALKMFIESLSPLSVENQGTDFKRAISEAQEAFERGGVDPDEGVRVNRVVLIASDGEDQEAGGVEQARKAAQDGIRIFTVAFGTERGAPIPIRDDRGYLRGYKKDRAGREVITTVKGVALRELAAAGKGSFHHASFGGQDARAIKTDLDQVEKAEFSTEMTANYDEKYQIFLLIGLLLSLIELIISQRRAAGRIWRGRFEVPQS